MPKVTLNATTTTEQVVDLKPAVRRKLLTELHTYASVKAELKTLEATLDAHKGIIADVLDESGEVSIAIDGFKVTLVAPVTRKLDEGFLIKKGWVTRAQLDEATKTTAVAPYVKVTTPKAGE